MNPEERIKLLEKRVDTLFQENQRLKKTQTDVHHFMTVMPKDRWYIAYLQSEIGTLERQYANQRDSLEKYQTHYKKYADFYTRYENERLTRPCPVCRSVNGNRSDTRYPQAEENKEKDVI